MKNIFYPLFVIISLLLFSCEDVLEETFNEIDSETIIDELKTELTIELSSDDYNSIGGDVRSKESLPSIEEAESTILPDFLKERFNFTKESTVNITYSVDATIQNPANESIVTVDDKYEVTETDYDSQGGNIARFDNFSQNSHIIDFLNDRYDAATVDFKVELTYVFFDRNTDPRTQTLTNIFTFDGTTWVTTETYTVTEADYDSQGGNVARFNNFSSDRGIDDIINFLNDRYNTAVADFKVALTYEYFLRNPNRTETTTNTFAFTGATWEIFEGTVTATNEVYEVTEDDYDSQGGNIERFNNFTEIEQVTTFLNDRYELTLDNAIVKLTYIFRENGQNNEVTNLFQSDANSNWNIIEGKLLRETDYEALGESDPFVADTEDIDFKLSIYLKSTLLPFAKQGDLQKIIYETSNSGSKGSNKTNYNLVSFRFDGNKWEAFPNDFIAVSNFKFDGQNWVADKTIKYVFTADDYSAVAAEFINREGFEDEAGNLDRFGNFNRGDGNTGWSEEQLLETFDFILKQRFSEIEVDQKYNVEIAIFRNGGGIEDFDLIFNADGNFEFVVE